MGGTSSLDTNPSTAGATAASEERTGATGDIVDGVEAEQELRERVGGRLFYTERIGSLASLVSEAGALVVRFIGTTS